MTKHTQETVTLPTGEKMVMSSPHMYRMSDNAWLTMDQAAFAVAAVTVMVDRHLGLPAFDPTTGDVVLVLANADGHPTDRVVFVMHPDGTAHSDLALPVEFHRFLEEHLGEEKTKEQFAESLLQQNVPQAKTTDTDTGPYL